MSHPDHIRNTLRKTLDDHRLTRGERRAFRQVLDEIEPTEQMLALYRSIAFDLAKEELADSRVSEVIGWLEDVVKLLESESRVTAKPAIAESHFSPGSDCPRRIAGLLMSARSSLDICVFTITDDRISAAIKAAHRRKVKVRVITDDDKASDRGSDIARLQSAGIPVRIDRSPYHMHHKFAIVDNDRLLTGSYNWTRGAAEKNEENFIITGDKRFVVPFRRLFEQLWTQFA